MTVNTNGTKVDLPVFTPRTTEERMNDMEETLAAIRESQLRMEQVVTSVEGLVTDFMERVSKNPMFKMMMNKV